MAYTPTTWVDDAAPEINATNLNHLEAGVQAAAATADAALPSSKITTSSLAGGPPGSPSNGDIWIATAVDSNGARWQFQYNAGSGSAYKWEFIGGFPLWAQGDPNAVANTKTQVGATGAWYDPATMSVTVARAGDYLISGCVEIDLNGGANGFFNVLAFAGASTYLSSPGDANGALASVDGRAISAVAAGVSASTTVGVALLPVTAGTNKLRSSSVLVTPRRIS